MTEEVHNPNQDAPKQWYNIKEASEYLGISQPTIFRWMKEGTLSFYKVGGSTRFSKEGLDALIDKTTGQKEAEKSAGTCIACGHSTLVEGRMQSTGKMYFKPDKSSFWVLHEAVAPTKAKVCPACGYIQLYADTDRLKKLKPKEIEQEEKDNS
jgi:excisionase family DNA binding protein